ncbi:hypothetical protein JT359_13470 [Candidatus Poribacteria bacterium]|nr:hypothetical protein [Candidatus Poribacteria bacterium]
MYNLKINYGMKNSSDRLIVINIFIYLFFLTICNLGVTEDIQEEKSPIKIGGAMRVNYAYGSYGDDDNPHRRSQKFGDVDLEVFRLNSDFDYHNIISRIEYRWYDTYSFIHTAWLGYELSEIGTIKAGIVRTPFGPTDYGVSTSWFFDQHFYVGLADDPDLGVTWNTSVNNLNLDLGYFYGSEFQTDGNSLSSSRYGYDIVKWEEKADENGTIEWGAGENGYDERHKLNLRSIYSVDNIGDFGLSVQYGMLIGTEVGEDDSGNYYALSGHMKNTFYKFTLFSQFSYYTHNITDDTPWGTGDLIPMGAYDFAWPIASTGMIPALSLRYTGIDPSTISWVDSVTPYIEWSSVLKTVEEYNNSTLITLGASWTLFSNLYVYSDIGITDGNFFVGNTADDYNNILTGVNHVGANGNNSWHWRLNFNIGYYF